jgi:hypothetical protein
MRRLSLSIMLIAVFLLSLAAVADAQEEKEQTRFVYATYFECDPSKQSRVDENIKHASAPAYDAAVEAGTISSWGWLAHHTGGKWRRLFYYSAPSLEELMDAADAIAPEIQKAHPSASQVLGEVCTSHEDYIWQVGTGSAGTGFISQDRGKVGMSVYFYCDMSKEERADEIVEEFFAPIYNKHVENGNISSWGWLKHYLGGKYRRAATLTAPDVKSLLAARNAIFADVNAKAEAASSEFGEICGSHQDYIWNILHETP